MPSEIKDVTIKNYTCKIRFAIALTFKNDFFMPTVHIHNTALI